MCLYFTKVLKCSIPLQTNKKPQYTMNISNALTSFAELPLYPATVVAIADPTKNLEVRNAGML